MGSTSRPDRPTLLRLPNNLALPSLIWEYRTKSFSESTAILKSLYRKIKRAYSCSTMGYKAELVAAAANRTSHPFDSRPTRIAGSGFGCNVWRHHRQPQQGGADATWIGFQPISCFNSRQRKRDLKIPNWNLRERDCISSICHSFSPRKALPCFPACCAARARSRSTSPSCALLSGCGKRSRCTRNSPTNFPNWNAKSKITTKTSAPCSKPFIN